MLEAILGKHLARQNFPIFRTSITGHERESWTPTLGSDHVLLKALKPCV